jgi:hypothetical protein
VQLRLVVYRPDPLQYTPVEVDLSRKPGRALGLTLPAPAAGAADAPVYLGNPVCILALILLPISHHSFINSQEGLTLGRWPIVKINDKSLPQHDEKLVVPTPLSEMRIGKYNIYRTINKTKAQHETKMSLDA